MSSLVKGEQSGAAVELPPPNDAARRTGGSSFVPMLPSTLHRSRSHKCSHRVVGLVYSSTDIESEWPSIYDTRPVSHVRWLCVTIVYLDWSVALSRSVLFSSRFSASGRSLLVSECIDVQRETPRVARYLSSHSRGGRSVSAPKTLYFCQHFLSRFL